MAPNEITRPITGSNTGPNTGPGAEVVEADEPSWSVAAPAEQTVPLVFASPHSGRRYPADLLAASPLDPLALRRSEDAFVDELYAAAPRVGAPLLVSHFPRVFLDCNREPYELDPGMFAEPLPAYVNTRSPRVAAGLGTIARVIATGEEVYGRGLALDGALARIRSHYFPYHQVLKALIDETKERFGVCLLIDCHSMPSIGGPMDADPGSRRVDIVLGNCFDVSCSPSVTAFAERVLRDLGYAVRRNVPYAGGFTTRHYGRPGEGVHALQIEINRALYMDERRIARLPTFAETAERIGRLIAALAAMNRGLFADR